MAEEVKPAQRPQLENQPEQIRATLFMACTEDWRAETAYAVDCDYAFAS